MKVPISWLKDYVDINISIEELEKKLFSCGFEVEEIIETGIEIKNICVGQIKSITSHPNADKLCICTIDAGQFGNKIQIVTGANNIKIGDFVPCALNNSVISGGKKIVTGEIRGVLSEGMLCSGVELGVTEDMYEGASVDGILILKGDLEAGQDIKEVVGLGDFILDINVTANRPDCQSIFGIAREVAAITNQTVKKPKTDYKCNNIKTTDFLTVEIIDKDLCPRYIAHYVSDATIEKSPQWIRKRLTSVGIRSINNIVDITNFVLIELGQPMHAFDYTNLTNKKIVVRRANNGEKLTVLDEKEHTFNNDNLLITDGKSPIAIAGIMGGLVSGIKDDTKNIIFESAKFARDNIRRSSKQLGVRTDSSSRFEKGVDSYTTEIAMDRALFLLSQMGCAVIANDRVDTIVEKPVKKSIKANTKKINSLLGLNLSAELIKRILNKLEFEAVLDGDRVDIKVPMYREDIENFADIAEEIIRIYGYDNIKPTFLDNATITNGGKNKNQKNIDLIKNTLVASGVNEIITYSFISPKDIEKLGFEKGSRELNLIKILNPLGEDLSVMRTSLVPSIINTITKNINRKNEFGRFFEIANIYLTDKTPIVELPTEIHTLILGAYGEGENFYTAKGILENLAKEFLLDFQFEKIERPYLHMGKSAKVLCDNNVIGYIGQFNPLLNEAFEIEKEVYLAEIDIDLLLKLSDKKLKYSNFPKLPSVERDLAIVLDEKITWFDLKNVVANAGGKYLKEINIFDVYIGATIEKGKKSLAFNMSFNADERTLSLEEVDTIISNILKEIKEKLNGYIRT